MRPGGKAASFGPGGRKAQVGADRNPVNPLILAVVLGATMLLFLLNSWQGIGVRPDSVRYMGLSVKPDDAPVYGTVLRGIASLGFDITHVAKVIGLLFICLNVAGVFLIMRRAGAARLPAAAGTALILFSPQFLELHALALSEPMFIFSMLVTAAVLMSYLRHGDRHRLVICGVALGIATLIRFPGVILGMAMAVVILFQRDWSLRRRIGDIALLALIGGGITLGWLVISQIVEGHSVGRSLAFNGNPDAARWLGGLTAMTTMLLPVRLPFPVRLFFLLTAVGASLALWIRFIGQHMRLGGAGHVSPWTATPLFFGVFAAFYVAFIVLAVFIEANLPINGRYLLPCYLAVIIATVTALTPPGGERPLPGLSILLLAAISLVVLASHVVRTAERTRQNFHEGIAFNSVRWRHSSLLATVRHLPRNAVIYSDAPDLIAYITGRRARFVPQLFDRQSGKDNPSNPFRTQLARLRHDLRKGHAYLVFVDGVDWRFYLASEQQLTRTLPLRLVGRRGDGRIYAEREERMLPPRFGALGRMSAVQRPSHPEGAQND